MKMKPTLPGNAPADICRVVWLCLLLAGLSGCFGSKPDPVPIPSDAIPFGIMLESGVASDPESIFNQLQFQKVHTDFQQSYLTLIDRINFNSGEKIDIKEQRVLFLEYKRRQRNYQETLKKVAEHEKDVKLKCFGQMKSLILAVLYLDKKTGKRQNKYDPDLLSAEGIMRSPPLCPENGKYSIIAKDGRRFFHCSIHGVLRN
jgi:hypothetical protein